MKNSLAEAAHQQGRDTGTRPRSLRLPSEGSERPTLPVLVWLYGLAGLVAAMVLVGGATRLTGSGLSITEWLPVRGVLPPLGEAAWSEAFAQYREIPQYQRVNTGMSLAEFKTIYWWEWTHRLLGRLIGLAFLGPFVVFLITGLIKRRHVAPLLGLFALGGLQGFVGWWMVSSGLVDRLDVSQVRLAVHLTLACVILAAILWVAGTLGRQPRPGDAPAVRLTATGMLGLVLVQIFLGGLVAGMDAGLSHNTWPLMDGRLVPAGLLAMEPAWLNLFENARTVQFNHRLAAYALLALAGLHVVQLLRAGGSGRRRAAWLGGTVLLQALIGIATLIAMVPLGLALAHQAGALAVLAVATFNMQSAAGYRADSSLPIAARGEPSAG